jgi:hypothetical protein
LSAKKVFKNLLARQEETQISSCPKRRFSGSMENLLGRQDVSERAQVRHKL